MLPSILAEQASIGSMDGSNGSWLGSEQPESRKLVKENIDKLLKHEAEGLKNRTLSQRIADAIARVAGSMSFAYFNLLFFAIWIGLNVGVVPVKAFDPFPFGMLTTIVSLEAIFLSIFVLVAQNRMQALSDRRSELGVQVSLLTEYEVTRILRLVDRLAEKLDVEECADPELAALEKDVDAAELIGDIESSREEGPVEP